MFRFPQFATGLFRISGHDTFVYEMGSSHSCTSLVVRMLSASLEQDALDELWNNWSDLELHVPLLSGDPDALAWTPPQ